MYTERLTAMQKKESKNFFSFFLRLLLPYLLVFILPIVSLGALIVYLNFHYTYDVERQRDLKEMENLAQVLSVHMDELDAIAYSISSNNKYNPETLLSHPYNVFYAASELSVYPKTNKMLNMIALYYCDEDILYTNAGYFRYDTYVDCFLKSAQSREDFRAALHSDRPCFVTDSSRGILHYIVPMRKAGKITGYSLFQVNRSVLDEVFTLTQSTSKVVTFITDNKGDLLIRKNYTDSAKSFDDSMLCDVSLQKEENIGQSLSAFFYDSPKLNWHFTIIVDKSNVLYQTSPWNRTVLSFYFILIICGLGVALLITFRQFRSMRKILERIEQSRINSIDDMAEAVITESNSILRQLDHQEPFVRAQMTLMLLDGSVGAEEALEISHEFQVLNGYHMFSALCLILDSKVDFTVISSIYTEIATFRFDNGLANACILPRNHAFAILVAFEVLQNPNIETAVDTLCRIIRKHTDAPFWIGAGNPRTNVADVCYSYGEAVMASEYCFMQSEKKYVPYSELSFDNHTLSLISQDELINLSMCLKRGDQKAASDALDALFCEIESQKTSPVMVRSMISEIICNIIRTAIDLDMYRMEFAELFMYQSLDDVKDRLKSAVVDICATVDQNNKKVDSAIAQAIMEAIRQRISQYDLSMECIANDLNVSVSYLGRILKKETGRTFVENVTDLRMQEAKKLLSSSDLSVAEITEKVGYTDASSFIRVFKRVEGVTPGAYRKASKLGNKADPSEP